MMNKKRIIELTYFNAAACIGVLLIHTLSYARVHCTPSSAAAAPVYYLWRIASFVVPAFLFSGAMKMSSSFDGAEAFSDYLRYILGRLKKIVLPYFLWCVVYYAFFLTFGMREFSVSGFIREFFLGTLSSQFYYIVITVQFYLLRPLWKVLVERLPAAPAIAFAAVITMVSLNSGTILQNFGISFAYSDRIFTSYLVFWVAGLYAGKNAAVFAEKLGRRRSWMIVAAIGILIAVSVDYVQFAFRLWFDLPVMKLCSDFLSIFLLFEICSVISSGASKIGKRVRGFLGLVYPASFSVFLSHLLFVTAVNGLMKKLGVTQIIPVTASYAAACVIPPFLLYYVFSKIKKLKVSGVEK